MVGNTIFKGWVLSHRKRFDDDSTSANECYSSFNCRMFSIASDGGYKLSIVNAFNLKTNANSES